MATKVLLIGIDKYQSKLELNNCVRDLNDIRDVLIEKFDIEEDEIIELYDSEATNSKIQDTLTNYINSCEKSDNLVIIYSGHGQFEDSTKTGYWLPYDANDHYSTWISNETLLSHLDKILSKHIFLISDSCFSNSILNVGPAKSNSEYNNRSSRWGLSSAFKHSYDSLKGDNSLFAETIIQFLKKQDTDFRVTELIEYVKSAFTTVVNQTPQGSPLFLKGHQGGEMLFIVKQESDARKFKGYKDFEKTLQLYDRNSEFKSIGKHEDKSKKIGFSLFQEHDQVKRKVSFYLYLYEGIVQTRTLKYLKTHYNHIFQKDLIIFLSKERTQVDLVARKANIEKKFMPLSTFYIDDFIRLHCTPRFKIDHSSNFLTLSNFVLPSYESESQDENIEQYIYDWFKKDDDPILVVIGAGGIGKTTFAQFIADKVMKVNTNTFVMFIDSVLIKDGLLKRKRSIEEINLYNFYEAVYELSDMDHEKLNEDLFRINLDAGNILLIIDGLDEVISKIPNFNVSSFLLSITESTKEIGGGKVIITCRSHFWDSTEFSEINFNKIELKAFNEQQTESFFQKSFNYDSAKVKKGLKIANEFKYPGPENNFHPYVLDIIRSMIQSDQETLDNDLSEDSSKILKSNVKNDYIIFRICDRERKRIGQISVDDQLSFFIYLATQKRGVIDIQNFKSEISTALDNKHVEKTSINAFKAHPFLHLHERSCRFKYDFLSDYFKGVYLTKYFEYTGVQNEPSNLFINLICENCWYGSPIISDIAKRIESWNEVDILFVTDLIDEIVKSSQKDIIKWKTVANIFNVCLGINMRFKQNNIEENTNLLTAMFQKTKGHIFNLSIININNIETKIKFDLSNLTLVKAYIG